LPLDLVSLPPLRFPKDLSGVLSAGVSLRSPTCTCFFFVSFSPAFRAYENIRTSLPRSSALVDRSFRRDIIRDPGLISSAPSGYFLFFSRFPRFLKNLALASQGFLTPSFFFPPMSPDQQVYGTRGGAKSASFRSSRKAILPGRPVAIFF